MKLSALIERAGLDRRSLSESALASAPPAGAKQADSGSLYTIESFESSGATGEALAVAIQQITDDSRAVDAGTLFAATPQGLPHLRKFLESGARAAAVLAPLECAQDPALQSFWQSPGAPPVLFTADVPESLGRLAAGFYGHPCRELQLIGVTGTNGKTTVTRMLYQIWRGLGVPAGVIGTLGALWECDGPTPVRREVQTGYTTPRSPQLQEILRRMLDDGVRCVALEVSSEALALGRLAGSEFSAAGFTNLSVDHLDFHGDFESYYQAKRMLFSMTAATGGAIVVARATEHGDRLAQEFAQHARCTAIDAPFIERLPAPTRFNQWNATLACVLAEQTRMPTDEPAPREKIAQLLATHADIPGRFVRVPGRRAGSGERAGGAGTIDEDSDALDLYGIVDYAHTPDALENLLNETRSLGARTLVCVFGCGGDRDRGKRPLMGAIAARLADAVIVCDDNPRQENPAKIRAEILAGAREIRDARATPTDLTSSRESLPALSEIGERRQAIRRGVELAVQACAAQATPAVVVVAGKGHEEYQIFADGRIDFSDVSELKAAFAAAESAHQTDRSHSAAQARQKKSSGDASHE
ncbi:MAG: UDP-N-acetylmuramoyl-L-alanyl-D-glutamate--2,6-diaminopimelate ligase [bacterium]|nr:UDP-N-acetylmuramoyl-L-alanyl-D-glutamate--2,6-diaminopimelate ligase [bacterium]